MFNKGDLVVITSFAYPDERDRKGVVRRYHYYDVGELCAIEEMFHKGKEGMTEYIVRSLGTKERFSSYDTQYVYEYQIADPSIGLRNRTAASFLDAEY